jgi:hypothetical protein
MSIIPFRYSRPCSRPLSSSQVHYRIKKCRMISNRGTWKTLTLKSILRLFCHQMRWKHSKNYLIKIRNLNCYTEDRKMDFYIIIFKENAITKERLWLWSKILIIENLEGSQILILHTKAKVWTETTIVFSFSLKMKVK